MLKRWYSWWKLFTVTKKHPFRVRSVHAAIFRVRRMSSVLLILHTKRMHASCCLVEHKVHPMSPLIAIFEVYLPTEQNNLAALFWTQVYNRILFSPPYMYIPYMNLGVYIMILWLFVLWLFSGRVKNLHCVFLSWDFLSCDFLSVYHWTDAQRQNNIKH